MKCGLGCVNYTLNYRTDIDAAEHGVPGARAVAARPRHLRLVALHRLPRLKRVRPQPACHQVQQLLIAVRFSDY